MKKNTILGWVLIALAVILIAIMIIPVNETIWFIFDILLIAGCGLGGIMLVLEK